VSFSDFTRANTLGLSEKSQKTPDFALCSEKSLEVGDTKRNESDIFRFDLKITSSHKLSSGKLHEKSRNSRE
jgi:hypothetical protein